MLVVVISNQPRWVLSKQRHKIARILHANLDLSTNQHMCVCVCVCERERESVSQVCLSFFHLLVPTSCSALISIELVASMFSVDFLELGGFRQIDFVQQKVSRRKKKKKKKKGGKDLGRFGIQRIKLIQLTSDHTCKVLGV